MASSRIICYDEGFIDSFERLREMIEAGDRPALHRYLIESFGFVFETFQYYAKHIAEGCARDFEEADEETKRELMRPLSHRQYRMIERSFSIWEEETEDVIWSIWDFLHDNGRIYRKKATSSAEVGGCSLILEQVYRVLDRPRTPAPRGHTRRTAAEDQK
ncbi:MAG: hypothetical protein IKQ60_04495 [Candidatus Methanomethylophilaceae archaeon]|nr:hypothetical protein [Candidatus Methanomethylophilaceae archaeon]